MIARDVMCESELLKVVIDDELDENVDETQDDRVKRIVQWKESPRTGTCRRTIESAKNDCELFSEHGYVPNLNVWKKMVSDETVMEFVRYIFQPSIRLFLAPAVGKLNSVMAKNPPTKGEKNKEPENDHEGILEHEG